MPKKKNSPVCEKCLGHGHSLPGEPQRFCDCCNGCGLRGVVGGAVVTKDASGKITTR